MVKKILFIALWIIAGVSLIFGVYKGVIPMIKEQIEIKNAKNLVEDLERTVRYPKPYTDAGTGGKSSQDDETTKSKSKEKNGSIPED